MRRNIPNLITAGNLLSGSLSIIFALKYGDLGVAAILIFLAAIFDFFDGLAARALGVSSPIGKDLDSLADVVSFGVAPAVLLFAALSALESNSYSSFFVLILGAAAAFRLAKFNHDTRQSTSFIGLPVPANALFWIGYIYLIPDITNWLGAGAAQWGLYAITAILVAFMSWMMNSELPMFSFKFGASKKKNALFPPILLLVVALIAIPLMGVKALPLVILFYITLCFLLRNSRG